MTDHPPSPRPLIAPPSEKVDAYVRLDKEERTIRKAQRAFNDARLTSRWSKQKSNDLRATGHDDALRIALLMLIATKAQSEDELETKQRVLIKHGDVLAPTWLLDPMVGAALNSDYDRLALSAASRKRFRAMLPREPTT